MGFKRKRFLAERKSAIVKAVVYDDWGEVQEYCKKYSVSIPDDETVRRVGIYKAACACSDIPDVVKVLAAKKCRELGFKPTMW